MNREMRFERNGTMSRYKRRRKHTVLLIPLILAGLFIAFCICGAVRTNKNKISPQVETYTVGETVDIGKNFFSDSVEDPSGYMIRVNSAELVSYEALLTSCDIDPADLGFSEEAPLPQYTYMVNVTIRNEENETGAIMALNYALCNRSLKIPVDYYLWGLMDQSFSGEPGFRLHTNSEKNITIPFTPMPSDARTDNEEISRRMEAEEFYFCVSEFPVRKQIAIRAS